MLQIGCTVSQHGARRKDKIIVTEPTRKGISKADQETSTNKHSHGLGSGLDGGRNTHDSRTKPDCSTATDAIGQVGGKGITCQRTNVLHPDGQRDNRPYCIDAHLNGVEQTQIPIRWVVESRFPLGETLQTVHHTTIVTSGRRSNETTSDVAISDTSKDRCGFFRTYRRTIQALRAMSLRECK